MQNAIKFWHVEHMRFKRLLDALERQLAVFHTGAQPNYQLMQDIIHYLHHYPDRFHHPREDVAFARLIKRDPTMVQQVNWLTQEHRVIAAAGAELLRLLDEILEDSIVSRERIEAAVATYLIYYRRHLRTEETQILPGAAHLLTQDDWAAVIAVAPLGEDALFGGDLVFDNRYCALREEIAREMSGTATALSD